MEFMNRSNRPSQPVSASAGSAPAATSGGSSKKSGGLSGLKLASVILLFAATILLVALLWFVALGSPTSEAKHVDDKKMQAVFLNGGQVYFGRIQDLNDSFMRVSDIYYLRVNQQVQPDQESQQASANDISLVKLGCELHGPEDEMIINREQVVFWENLKDDGQVAEAVAEYRKQNPNGQNCEQPQQSNTNNTNNTSTEESTTPAEE